MKLTNIALGLATATAIFITGCSMNQQYSDESLSLRKDSAFDESKITGDKTTYSKTAAGASTKIARSFENAPPMIPHDVEGMLPITISNNSCTGCHAPEVAMAVGATAIPKSHFTDFRPTTSLANDGKITKNGTSVTNTSDFKTGSKSLNTLSGTRFNCSQCHAPQSEGELVGNTFEADFRSVDLNSKSNLIDNINEGVK